MSRWDFARELREHGPDSRCQDVSKAAAYCEYVAKSHYENFTVVSLLLPRSLRPHFHTVYAWCRWADDLADETNNALPLLGWWRAELDACYRGAAIHPITTALAATVGKFAIPQALFDDLLSAFEQDQQIRDYDTFAQLLDYCRRSANPVGRIVLHLFESIDESRARLSDEICTGLQLANFWQDVRRDFEMGRVYLPREDRQQFGCDLSDPTDIDAPLRELIQFEVERTRNYFVRGSELPSLLPRQARIDVTLFLRGGEAILDAIAGQDYDVWSRRPEVSKWKKMRLMVAALPLMFTPSLREGPRRPRPARD